MIARRRMALETLARGYLGDTVRYVQADADRLVDLLLEVERGGLELAAAVADVAALDRGPDNRRSNDPVAAYQSGACKAAWRIREAAREYGETRAARRTGGAQ